jgi:hypothetical protein
MEDFDADRDHRRRQRGRWARDGVRRHQGAIRLLFETLAPADRATLIRLIGDLESRMRPVAGLAAPEAG